MAHFNDFSGNSQVRDDAHAESADATMVGNDDFRHSAHAHGVGTEGAIHAIFCRCPVSWALRGEVNAFNHLDAFFLSDVAGLLQKCLVVGFVHIRETGTRREVWPVERMFWQEVDVVGDEHEVANFKFRIHTSRGVADEEVFDAQFIHDTDRESHLLHVVAFIIMETSFERHDFLAAQATEEQTAAVALNG